jgi:hypothetical protein
MTGKKYEPPLYLDAGFEEALTRFAQTDKSELEASMARAKSKRPPGQKAPTAKPRQTATPSSRSKKSAAD